MLDVIIGSQKFRTITILHTLPVYWISLQTAKFTHIDLYQHLIYNHYWQCIYSIFNITLIYLFI